MTPVWERKKSRAKKILMGIPLTLILVVVNVVLFSWLVHLLHSVFTDALDHMSLLEWTEKLYFMVKNTIDKILGVISISS
jgi:type II secretory pathway component PulM